MLVSNGADALTADRTLMATLTYCRTSPFSCQNYQVPSGYVVFPRFFVVYNAKKRGVFETGEPPNPTCPANVFYIFVKW